MERRDFLRVGGVAAGAALLSGCSRLIARNGGSSTPIDAALPTSPTNPTVRLINRLSFGHCPGEIAMVDQMGREAYVDEQLRADQPEDARLTLLLHRIDALRMNGDELRDLPRDELVQQIQRAALLHAVYGKNQLLERMADLWTNHFNIYALKGDGAYRKAADDVAVVRRHALGRFPDMLRASAKSPAMLAYLDNPLNRRGVANENYARELLELHTMGVSGGYTQRDVMEVAKCFTGWGVEDRFLRPKGKFRFDPAQHDDGAKTVLGKRISAGGGIADGETVLDMLSSHPATARFIAGKVCREFLGVSNGPWVDKLAVIYLETGGDIRSMLRPLLMSDQLLVSSPIVKRPLDFVASALRCLDSATDCGKPVLSHLERMGQSPHLWPMPDGYPVKASAWSGSLLGRWSFALALTGGELGGTESRVDELVSSAGGGSELVLGESGRYRSPKAIDSVALCLASPEFQWR